jgi:hypothetical protein
LRRTLTIFAILSLYGCIGYQQVAKPQFAPIFKKKNELTSNFGFNHYNVGYSATNHLFIFTDGFRHIVKYEVHPLSSGKEGEIRRTEKSKEFGGGIGYYLTKEITGFSVLAGGSIGNLHYNYVKNLSPDYTVDLIAKKYSAFIQPSFNVQTDGSFYLNVSMRLSNVHFSKISNNVMTGSAGYTYSSDESFNTPSANFFFLDPGFVTGFGNGWAKFETKVLYSIRLSRDEIRYRHFSINLGVTFFVALKKKNMM